MSEIGRLRALRNAGTPGIWRAGVECPEDVVLWARGATVHKGYCEGREDCSCGAVVHERWLANVGAWGGTEPTADAQAVADASLIAAAVNSLPALLDVAEAARAVAADEIPQIEFTAIATPLLVDLRTALERLDGAS